MPKRSLTRILYVSLFTIFLVVLIVILLPKRTTHRMKSAIAFIPKAIGLYTSSDGTGNAGTWTPWTVSGGTTLSFVPGATGAYCSTDGTGNAGTWAPCVQASQATGVHTAWGYCTGTATSSTANLSVMMLGGNNVGCTGTFQPTGMEMIGTGTLSNLRVRCNATGFSAASGVFTVQDFRAGVNTVTPITVTYGTATANSVVSDSTHTYAYQDGDMVRINFTTQATETLGYCSVSFSY